jgi:hypothetical protein
MKEKGLKVIMIILFLLLIYVQVNKSFSWDELEHIHSTYLISEGLVPYKDFFQHHHPLMWYLYAPIFWLDDTRLQLILVKFLSLFVGVLNLLIFLGISKELIKGRLGGDRLVLVYVGGLILISNIFYLRTAFEFRPDNLMLTFFILPIYLLLKESGITNKKLIITGICFGISFLLLGLISVITYVIYRKQVDITKVINSISLVLVGFIIPVIPFFTIVFVSGIWDYYIFFNWRLNAQFLDIFSPMRTINRVDNVFLINIILILLIIVSSTVRLSLDKLKDKVFFFFTTFCLGLIVSLFTIVRSPYPQYFLPIIYFAGLSLVVLLYNYRKASYFLFYTLLAYSFFTVPLYYLQEIKGEELNNQIDRIIKVEGMSLEERKDIEVQRGLNLFTTKDEYFWYSKKGEATFRSIEESREVPDV